jgi:multiple sugar transport system permease protein
VAEEAILLHLSGQAIWLDFYKNGMMGPEKRPMTPLKRNLTYYLMLTPYLIGLIGLVLVPALFSLGLAFTHYDALTPPEWSGLANLHQLFADRLFGVALGNTLIYLSLAVILRIGGALLLALLLQRQGRILDLARITVYLPTIIPDVAYALIWLVALNPRFGPINLLLGTVNLPTPVWVAEPWPARLALVLMAVWQLGEGFIILLVSLNDIPRHLHEAAAIDGAGPFARFRYVTLPLLLPRLLLLTARDAIISLQANFVPSLIVTKGGPGYATLFLPLYSYLLAFDDFRFGYAAAVVWMMYLITVLVIGLQYFLGKRWPYSDAY